MIIKNKITKQLTEQINWTVRIQYKFIRVLNYHVDTYAIESRKI